MAINGESVKAFRADYDMTQAEFAEKAGIPASAVSRIENNRESSEENLEKAEAYINSYSADAEGEVQTKRLHGEILHSDEHTKLVLIDLADPQSGANHAYAVFPTEKGDPAEADEFGEAIETINFQKGPRAEVGVNGLQNEDLLRIVINRLKGFQVGNYPSNYNEVALSHAESALNWLEDRTRERKLRGVEGKNLA